eukprot:493339-Prymnesium_polylepis.2
MTYHAHIAATHTKNTMPSSALGPNACGAADWIRPRMPAKSDAKPPPVMTAASEGSAKWSASIGIWAMYMNCPCTPDTVSAPMTTTAVSPMTARQPIAATSETIAGSDT